MKCGFGTVPIIHFEALSRDDYQLNLVEQYIIRLRHSQNKGKQIIEDFKFLRDKPKRKKKSRN